MPNADLCVTALDTPLGRSRLVYDGSGTVHAFGWYEGDRWLRQFGAAGVVAAADPFGLVAAMQAYFAGAVRSLDRIAVHFSGTSFQTSVWQALRAIPAGETTSYGALAKRLGQPGAMRAVGLANGANPIGVIVPCHRVIGADGSLTGYGGGIDRKRWLLAHEAHHSGTGLFALR
jgi:methylated-DNA-[protein]-cysteine S-methyltransferase